MAFTAQEFISTGEYFNEDPSVRTFTAGVDLIYVVQTVKWSSEFVVTLLHTTDFSVLDTFTGDKGINVAAYNNRGDLVLMYGFGSNRTGWTVTNDGTALAVTSWTLPNSVVFADFGNSIGLWMYYDVITLSPSGNELFVGGLDVVGEQRVGRMWCIDTSTGDIKWFLDNYYIPAQTGLLGPCIGSPVDGMAISCWETDLNNGFFTYTFYLISQNGLISTLVNGSPQWGNTSYYDGLSQKDYWCETNEGRLTYVIGYPGYDGTVAGIRSLQVVDSALTWESPSQWTLDMGTSWRGGDDPFYDLPRDAWDGQIAMMPGVTTEFKWPLWFDAGTLEWASGEGFMSDNRDYLQVHAVGKLSTIRSNFWQYGGGLVLDKWGFKDVPPVKQPYHSTRLGNRNDGMGTFEKHPRMNQTGWQQWSSNLGQRITPWGKGSYQ